MKAECPQNDDKPKSSLDVVPRSVSMMTMLMMAFVIVKATMVVLMSMKTLLLLIMTMIVMMTMKAVDGGCMVDLHKLRSVTRRMNLLDIDIRHKIGADDDPHHRCLRRQQQLIRNVHVVLLRRHATLVSQADHNRLYCVELTLLTRRGMIAGTRGF